MEKYMAFKSLLTHDKRAHELMADGHRYRNRFLRPFIPVINMDIRTTYSCFLNFKQDIINDLFKSIFWQSALCHLGLLIFRNKQ